MTSRSLGRLLKLSWHERGVVLQAALFYPLIDLALNLRGFRWTQDRLARLIPAKAVTDNLVPGTVRWIVDGTGQHLYRATCLRRSLLLWWLLQRRGINCEIKIGAPKKAAEFSAHAWVEWQGKVLNDRPDIRQRYIIFDHWPSRGA